MRRSHRENYAAGLVTRKTGKESHHAESTELHLAFFVAAGERRGLTQSYQS
jgi:hypothetical protein